MNLEVTTYNNVLELDNFINTSIDKFKIIYIENKIIR